MPPLDPYELASPVVGPVSRAEPVQGFAGNQTFRLHTASGTYYLKSGTAVAAEARACELARSVDVPSPHVVAVSLTAPAYLITAELPGSPVAADATAVLVEAGLCLRRLHTIQDPSADWPATLLGTLENLEDVVPVHLAERLRDVIPPFVDTVAGIKPVLLHADLHPRHLYAVGNQLTGILDWGDTMYGDPLFDLARFSMVGPAATATFLTGYGQIDAPDRTLSLYRVLWSLMALHAEQTAGGTWFQAHIDTIGAELSR